mgnify:CR=1 FL=1
MNILAKYQAHPMQRRSASFILSLEAMHVFLLLLTLANSIGLVLCPVTPPSLGWIAWVLTGVIIGIINYCLYRRCSMAISSLGLLAMLGASILAASATLRPPSTLPVLMPLGTVFMSGAVVAATCFHLQNSNQLFLISTKQAAALFLTCLLSPLIVMEMWTVASLLPLAHVAKDGQTFNALSFEESGWIRLYPLMTVLLALLTTHPLWLFVATRVSTAPCQTRVEPVTRRSASRDPLHHKSLLIVAVAVGFVLGSYRLLLGYPLTGDAHYYLSVMELMDRFGVRAAISTDRPVFFLILYSLSTCFSIEAEPLLRCLPIALAGGLVASTYAFVSSCFEDKRLAILSAFLASVSPHVIIGIHYFLAANWLGLILMIILFTAVLKSIRLKSRAWAILTIALCWLMLGIHFPTWGFTILVLVAYTVVSYLKRNLSQDTDSSSLMRITIGCLLAALPAVLFSLVTPEISASIQHAWSRAADFVTRMTPVNIALFFQDARGLSNYSGNETHSSYAGNTAYGGYAAPLSYALALLGLRRPSLIRGIHVGPFLSWVAVSYLGLVLIPAPEQWRLLYMMPVEMLAAAGLGHILVSVGVLEDPLAVNIGNRWLRGAVLTGSLLVGSAILMAMSAPPILAAAVFTIVGWLLTHDLSPSQTRQIAGIVIILLYVLANVAATLYIPR